MDGANCRCLRTTPAWADGLQPIDGAIVLTPRSRVNCHLRKGFPAAVGARAVDWFRRHKHVIPRIGGGRQLRVGVTSSVIGRRRMARRWPVPRARIEKTVAGALRVSECCEPRVKDIRNRILGAVALEEFLLAPDLQRPLQLALRLVDIASSNNAVARFLCAVV